MSSKEMIIRGYEELLLGKRKNFFIAKPIGMVRKSSDAKYTKEKKEMINYIKEKDAISIIRYAITSILGWTPQEAMNYMTKEIMEQLHLDKINKYIEYPSDLNREIDFQWMIHKAFPKETKYDISTQILRVYERLLKEEIKKFPKNTFKEPNGTAKLTILMHKYISDNIPSSNLEQLYHYFSDTTKANEDLRKAKLYYAYMETYETPLEFFHESMGEMGDDFLFAYYQYISILFKLNKHPKKKQVLKKQQTYFKTENKI